MTSSIAIVGMSCRFPDARNPGELWQNCLDGRRSFRAIPASRLDLSAYSMEVAGIPDSIMPIRAGLLTDWQFDRAKFRIPQSTFESTDLVHWLGLELAAETLSGVHGMAGLDRKRTAVVVANTLTGEFSRAGLLRMRGPFLDGLIAEVAAGAGLGEKSVGELRSRFIALLREKLPAPTEDSLAGGLANTIAGRIANYFDLGGGAYSVDGACASSLVAVADAANLIVTEQADAVLVGAVDLSLDPFELVGFSRAGAFAKDDMRVFDARSNGFWPGEGGACIVLARSDVALRTGMKVHGHLRGWGISSDGAGGLIRPSSDGQYRAYRQAYERAAVSPEDVSFVEAHGTGTALGDPTEVRALALLRKDAAAPLTIGSIKANIGHTKAAAGLAGFIKTVAALEHRTIPIHTGCIEPHSVFAEVDGCVQPALSSQSIRENAGPIAGVSSFGFGGINAHVVIEGAERRSSHAVIVRRPLQQDVQLFTFAAADTADLCDQLVRVEKRAQSMSLAELAEAAATVVSTTGKHRHRVALVVSDGEQLLRNVRLALSLVRAGEAEANSADGVFVGRAEGRPRIGLLFPGQGAPVRVGGGIWARRFDECQGITYTRGPSADVNLEDTAVAQPTIVAASLAGLQVLGRLGVTASVGVGHSLGEISGLVWAGILNSEAAVDLARVRGRIMRDEGAPDGVMARVAMARPALMSMIGGLGLTVACENGPDDYVLAGTGAAMSDFERKCVKAGAEITRLRVSRAFHSPLMQPAVGLWRSHLADQVFREPINDLVSTVTTTSVTSGRDVPAILRRQLVEPVLFDAALDRAADAGDIFLEVGPGETLSRLARRKGLIAYSLDVGGNTLGPLMKAAAALFVAGENVNVRAFVDPLTSTSFDFGNMPQFLTNPCGNYSEAVPAHRPQATPEPASAAPLTTGCATTMAAAIAATAYETGLPAETIRESDRFLDDLHLNSLAVTRLVSAAARASQTRMPRAPTEFANATVQELAEALEELRTLGEHSPAGSTRVPGVRRWIRPYEIRWTKALSGDLAQLNRMPLPFTVGGLAGTGKAVMLNVSRPFGAEQATNLVKVLQQQIAGGVRSLVLAHEGVPVSPLARSIFLEGWFDSLTVIDVKEFRPADGQLEEICATRRPGFHEYCFDRMGEVLTPQFVPAKLVRGSSRAIDRSDVVVVSGGGRGITAECALRLGQTGATLILLGRSPASDTSVVRVLQRASDMGVNCHYVSADASDADSLSEALRPLVARIGLPTLLLHAAGVNEPCRFDRLDREQVSRTITPKVTALDNLLQLFGASLRKVIAFGSLIGRIGLDGEAHYALANAMQTVAVERWAASNPQGSGLSLEWSVWGGTGMGERIGTVERLEDHGVDALSVDDALEAFESLIARDVSGSICITSRFGPPPYLSIGDAALPAGRFLDDIKVFYPGVELVAETVLTRGRDRYLDDHVIDGVSIAPGVMMVEALAQCAKALGIERNFLSIHNVKFHRPLTVPNAGGLKVRLSALRDATGGVTTNITCELDDFDGVCVEATFSNGTCEPRRLAREEGVRQAWPSAPLSSLYGNFFFQRGRFRRLASVEALSSRKVEVLFSESPGADWFGAFDSQECWLWDPGVADAALHALQLAVPHRRVLPLGIGQLSLLDASATPVSMRATEVCTTDEIYEFQIELFDSAGKLVQSWSGVKFKSIGTAEFGTALQCCPPLILCRLERLGREELDDSLSLVLVRNGDAKRQERGDSALALIGISTPMRRRLDGSPEVPVGLGSVSLSHAGPLTLAVRGRKHVGCDIAQVQKESSIDDAESFSIIEALRKLSIRPPATAVRGAPSRGIRVCRAGDAKAIAVTVEIDGEPWLVSLAFREEGSPSAMKELPHHGYSNLQRVD